MTTINLDGVVGWDIDAQEFAATLDSLTGDITFELNSGGGYVTDGIAILNKIRSYDKGKTTANISYAASMMTQIALACDEVNAYDNAIFMIHNVQGMAMGDHNDMREQADLQERMSEMLAQLYVKQTGLSEDEILAMMDADTYLFGQEIIDSKFANNIIDTDKEKDKLVASANSKTLFANVKKAMEEEKLSLSDMKSNLKLCQGNCNLVASNEVSAPTASDSDKSVIKKQGAIMTEQEIQEMQNSNKVLLANRVTLQARTENLEASIDTITANLDAKTEEFTALTASMDSQISEAVEAAQTEATALVAADKEATLARVEEAFATDVANKETIVAMLNAETAESASEIAIAAKEETQALKQGETPAAAEESKMLAYANTIKGSMK